jgi:hypothetical protein
MDLGRLSLNVRMLEGFRRHLEKHGCTTRGYPLWTADEDEICRKLCPDFATLQKEIPRRTRSAIVKRCLRLGLGRKTPHWTAAENKLFRKVYSKVSLDDLKASFPSRSYQSLRKRANKTGLSRPRALYKITGHHLIDDIRHECYKQHITMVDLDFYCQSGKYFAWHGWKRKIDYKKIAKAIETLGGRLTFRGPTPR